MYKFSIGSFLLSAVVTAQVATNPDITLKNWPAPLYWQPSAPETESIGLRPEIRETAPKATSPVGSLVFIAMTPCRVVDTRSSQGFPNPFGPPGLTSGVVRTFPLQLSGACTIPANAMAYSLNVTVVPPGSLGFLKIWPSGQSQPNAVTIDDVPGDIRNNAAIVPAGIPDGSLSAVTNGATDLVLDINGYYAPSAGMTLGLGSAAAPSLSFLGDAGTGLFSSGMGTLNLATGGTNRLTVRSDGDLDLAGNIRKGGTLFLHNVGTQSTAVGLSALTGNVNGSFNTAIGASALHANSNGFSNTAAGAFALSVATTGSNNTAAGDSALTANLGGSNNTAMGQGALASNTSGNGNTAIGYQAGSTITTTSNNIDIGNSGTNTDVGAIRIGTAGSQTSLFAAGIAGVSVSNSAPVLINTMTGQLGTLVSSRRYKEDIDDMGDASTGLLRLRPVTYHYKQPYPDGSKPLDYGLIAEEVAEVYPDLVVKDKDGQVETVQYHKLIPMLLNEVQKLQGQLAELRQMVKAQR